MLKKIKPARASDLVFEQLRDFIFRGRIKPGERLMTERELSLNLGVSRPTVREAINRLVAQGLLEHKQGQGTFLSPTAFSAEKNPFAAMITDREISLLDLLEVRLALECSAARMAATRATEEDIIDLERSLEEMSAEAKRGELGQEPDVAFHMGIAYASKNSVYIHIMKNLFALFYFGITKNRQNLASDPDNLGKIAQQHAKILENIRARDPDSASRAMEEHIKFVVDFTRRADNPSFSV